MRTDPDAPKHAGVTMMAIDMKAPGVKVNPLRGITGDAHFNEVFFDDVFVPDEDVVGDVNKRLAGGPRDAGQRAHLDRRRFRRRQRVQPRIDLVKLLDSSRRRRGQLRAAGR